MIRLFDVRPDERRSTLAVFGLLLLLIIGAHTILETTRDAILLGGPGAKALGWVYIGIAVATWPAAALVARAGRRYGQRRALAWTLELAVVGPIVMFFVPTSHGAAMATYILSGVLGSIVVPQFWTLTGAALTLSQGRRLFGLVATGGVIGGVLGPAVASGALMILPVKGLLLIAASVFCLARLTLVAVDIPERTAEARPARKTPLAHSLRPFRDSPFMVRLAAVVFLSTATFLALDYLFKSSVARSRPGPALAPFIAHYYLVLNVVSLIVQLGSGMAIRRLGVLGALASTPFLLFASAAASLLSGGALPGVLLVKGIDGSTRYSIHRVTEELMYLPVPPADRQRTKPLIDGMLVRFAQMIVGGTLLTLVGTRLNHPIPLAALVAGLAAAWLAAVATMRRPYLELLRSAIRSGSAGIADTLVPLDLETAQIFVQSLASEEPTIVQGAMLALARRGRPGLIPALVLLHSNEDVLVQALELFGESSRVDWFALARRLLDDSRESVRVASARALARHQQLDPASLLNDAGWRARGYAAVRMALRDSSAELANNANILGLLARTGEQGSAVRLGMLAACADARQSSRLIPLLDLLAQGSWDSREYTELLAEAVTRQKDERLIGRLVSHLSVREGREAVRATLVALGGPALDEVLRTLRDPSRPRRLRLHMPKTLARFGSQRAGEALLTEIETERDGLVRYKAVGALRSLVTFHGIVLDRLRTERLCVADLEEYFRRLAILQHLETVAASGGATGTLLMELLEEKAAHAFARAFELLQIAHPREPVHRAYIACRSRDLFTRSSAAELVDAILRRRDQRDLRALFRLATDDLSRAERVERARAVLGDLPSTPKQAWDGLAQAGDAVLVALGDRLRAQTEPPSLFLVRAG